MYPIAALCRLAGVSRSGYYRWLDPPPSREDDERGLVDCIRELQQEVGHIYGYRRMKLAVERRLHEAVNRKRVARIQREQGMQARIRRKRRQYPRITAYVESARPDHLRRAFTAERPDQKWVTDITYIQVGDGWLYLSAVMDLFNREIIAYRTSSDLGLSFVLETIRQAFRERRPERVLVHSDQGAHYHACEYAALLQGNHAIQSMSRRGECLDNAAMENFFSHFKCELVQRMRGVSKEEVKQRIDSYISFYNNERIQEKLKMAPVEYRSHFSQTS